MKIIKQSYEIINQTDFSIEGIEKFVEKCARVSYKSEDKITEDSYKQFVQNLIKNDHGRPLELGTVYLTVPIVYGHETKLTNNEMKILRNPYTKYLYDDKLYITTNYRVIIGDHMESLLKYLSEPTKHYKRYTVHFIINRGVMDEFRTHVSLSHLAESTRFCSSNKDRFENEVTFILPHWWEKKDWNNREFFLKCCRESEKNYFSMLEQGFKAQDARDVLPLDIKSELISCGFGDAWENFFYRRTDKAAHPMAHQIAMPLQTDFKEILKDSGVN